MMHVEKLNIYEHFGLSKPAHATGELSCLYVSTSKEISPNRRARPAVLILPGGGYGMVSDREAEPIALRFLQHGYAAFILRYSIEPVRFPTALREAALAMRFIRENREKYEVDPQMVAAIGFSAGGHLCATLGTMFDCPEVADIAAGDVIRPNALGLCYPVAVSWGATHMGSFLNLAGGDEALMERLSVERLVRPDMPPVYLWHTRDDRVVPVRNSTILANALVEHGVDFAMHISHYGQHGLSTTDVTTYPSWGLPAVSGDTPGWVHKMITFFAECGLRVQDLPRV